MFFRSGRRQNEIMQALAAELSDTDIRNLGAYFASLPPPADPAAAERDKGLSDAGSRLSTERRCNACHRDDFSGQQAAARLARQREEYLVKALDDYRSGARPSTGVAAMAEIAGALSEADTKAVSHYLAHLP